jgi:hypothetical protein
MEWKTDDPRFHINKRANIVILYSDNTGYHKQAVAAQVETKHGWTIVFNSYHRTADSLKDLYADDEWPLGWLWAFQVIR